MLPRVMAPASEYRSEGRSIRAPTVAVVLIAAP